MSETPISLAGLRLLVVEDEALVAMMLEQMLAELGCNVIEIAGSLALGLALLDGTGVQLDGAILDVNLGGDKVFPVAEKLSEQGVPFIFSTGYGTAGIATEFAHVPVLAKPYDADALAETLGSVLLAA
jgi:CheY-like chemotaxis protein